MTSRLSPLLSAGTFISKRTSALLIISLLFFSLLSLFAAPLMLPSGYSWVTRTTSEAAAQGLSGAWLARLGFLLLGVSVIWLSTSLQHQWSVGTRWLHMVFGLLMIATAAFSHRPWISGVSYDPFEDFLHSFMATAMGFAFSIGVFLRFFQRSPSTPRAKVLDMVTLAAAIVIPLLMANVSAIEGILQRVMFFIAYIWYANESLSLYQSVE